MSVAGLLGLIAIGFVAVWSILSNVVAGMLLFFSQMLRIEDQIELLPDGIGGKVPHNFFFQRYVKHIEKREPV